MLKSTIVTLLMALLLTACGKDNSTGSNPPQTNPYPGTISPLDPDAETYAEDYLRAYLKGHWVEADGCRPKENERRRNINMRFEAKFYDWHRSTVGGTDADIGYVEYQGDCNNRNYTSYLPSGGYYVVENGRLLYKDNRSDSFRDQGVKIVSEREMIFRKRRMIKINSNPFER